MLTMLGALLTSVVSGGATGLLGVLFQRYFDMKNKQQDLEVIKANHANALALKKVDVEIAEKAAAAQVRIAVEQKEGQIGEAEAQERARGAEADSAMFVATVESDRALYLTPDAQKDNKWAAFMMGMVDWVRGMTRPVLTGYLVVISHQMFLWVQVLSKNGVDMTSTEKKEMAMLVVSTILYLSTTAVVWWFGTRPPKGPKAR